MVRQAHHERRGAGRGAADYALLRFEVSGLRGGHSGIDIHLGRGNAIKLLAKRCAICPRTPT